MLWTGFGGGCETNNDGDPIVLYDKLANRWVMSQFSVSTTPYLQCVAVSVTPDATGSWYRYSFQYTYFDDYPKMGVWPDAYYETFNMFDGDNFVGADACAYNRTAMLNGQPATQICFQQTSSVGRPAARRCRRHHAAAHRLAELHADLRREFSRPVQVSRRLQQSLELHLHRADRDCGRGIHAAVQRRMPSACRSPAPTTSWTRSPIA